MNWKTWVPLIAAILMGLFAAKLGRDVIARNHVEKAAPPQMSQVVVAKNDVSPGLPLKDTDVTITQMPPTAVPVGAFTMPADVLNRVTLTRFVKGQPILDSMLLPLGAAGGLQGFVPEGMRAVTFEVNEVSGLAGLLQPGCRVDIVMTLPQENSNQPQARTVAQNLKIVAVGRRVINNVGDPEPTAARSVTLLTSPREAELIELATHVGSPRLVLRGAQDVSSTFTTGVTIADLKQSHNPLNMLKPLASIFGQSATPASATADANSQDDATRPNKFRSVELIRAGAATMTQMEIPPAPSKPPVVTPTSTPQQKNSGMADTSSDRTNAVNKDN